jgi:hypothetical protein
MIERQPGRFERVDGSARRCDDVGEQAICCCRRVGVAVQDDVLDRGQGTPEFVDDVAPVVPAAGIGDGVAGSA